jgi:hypothetical protein
MSTCFVIQPFDGGKFDKRYEDVFKPAIVAAGLTPYRVDQDASVEVPIESIERQIRSSRVCLADISLNNPNVWYELGFAFASNRPTVMVCSKEREGRYPFDIQHRAVISYESESPRDFERLRDQITARLEKALAKADALAAIESTQTLTLVEGLSQPELIVLATLAAALSAPDGVESLWSVKSDVEQAGLTAIGFQLGLRRLTSKGFVKSARYESGGYGDDVPGAAITDLGWQWIDTNEGRFVTKRRSQPRRKGAGRQQQSDPVPDDDIPF